MVRAHFDSQRYHRPKVERERELRAEFRDVAYKLARVQLDTEVASAVRDEALKTFDRLLEHYGPPSYHKPDAFSSEWTP